MDHQHGLVTGFAVDKGVDLWFTVNGSGFTVNGSGLRVYLGFMIQG